MILRSFLIFFSLTLSLYSIDVTVSLGSNGKQSYSLVEVVSEQNFVCEHIEETHLRRDYIKCRFKKIPLSKPVATENSFFQIKPYIKRREFYLEVIPKFNGELYSQTISTLENRTVYKKNIVNSNTWLVLGFDGKNPFFKSRKYDGINFPVKIKEWDYPTIGALDIGGYPIGKGKDYDDFVEYNSLKRLFVKKDFRTLLSRIDRKLEKQEINKLFMPEILAFKIKAMDEQGNRQREVIEIGAPWIVSYTSHKDLPEMMLIVAKAYLDMGIIHEANSILDTLITEYPGNSYAEYAMIFRADRWRKEGKTANAKKYYDKVLYSSDDIEVASLAAYRLARYYIVGENLEKAKELYQKIINSNPKFYLKDYEITLNLAKELVDRKIPYIAAQIGEILSNSIDPTSQYYQKQLLYNARWYRKAGRLKKSLEFFDKFLVDYSYVKNIQDIRKEIDFIKFELDEGTSKERLAFYNTIIQKYPTEEIASHAKYKKMGILVHEKRHNEIKDYLPTYENLDKKLFPNLNEEVRRIARKLVKVYLDGKDCKNSIDLIYKYNILIPKSYDDTMSYCGFQLGDYDFVVNLSNKYIESNSPADSIKWQRRKADALYKKSDYLEYILQAQRISRIDKALENKPDKEMYLKLFKAYNNIGQNDKLIPLMKEIKGYFPKEARILDLYKTIIEVALKDKKYETVDLYGTKLLNQQRVMNIDVFSPFVEFALAEAGVEQKVYDKAINVLNTLVTQELDLDDRFQGLYRLGELYSLSGNGNKSKETFEKCKQLEGESSWKELCKQR